MRARAEIRRRTAGGRLRDTERCGDQPGAGLVRHSGDDARGDRARTVRRHVLVRRFGVAGGGRHADQRGVMGNDRRGRGSEPGGNPAHRQGVPRMTDWSAVRGEFPVLAKWTYLNTATLDRKSTRLNSSHLGMSYAV